MNTGAYISGMGHALLIAWALLGGLFLQASDPLPVATVEATITNPIAASIFDLYRDPREERPTDSIKYGPWAGGQFAGMVKRHMIYKMKHPDRPPTRGMPYGGIENLRPETKEILIEAATFHPTRVRRTAARLGLRTDASTRFEKHLDPTLPEKAAAHLVHTLRSIQPEVTLPQPMGDAGDWTDPAHAIELRGERVRQVLGAPVPDAEIERILTAVGFGLTSLDGADGAWTVAIPSNRATKDVGIEEDLIEEVGRMYGYGNIDERPLEVALTPAPRDERRRLVRNCANHIVQHDRRQHRQQ